MLRTFVISLTVAGLLAACAGRSADPIQVAQPRDRQLQCNEIEAQMLQYSNAISDLDAEISRRNKRNIGWGVAGIFLFPLWFALDLGDAPEAEKAAYQKRKNQLARYGSMKNCQNLIY